jgi:hypothetical protein
VNLGLAPADELARPARRLLKRQLGHLVARDEREAWLDEEAEALAEKLADVVKEHAADLRLELSRGQRVSRLDAAEGQGRR